MPELLHVIDISLVAGARGEGIGSAIFADLGEMARELVGLADKDRMTTLMYSAWNGQADMVDRLVKAVPAAERREFINAPNKYGRTALDIARSTGRKEIASLLVVLGANANPDTLAWIAQLRPGGLRNIAARRGERARQA